MSIGWRGRFWGVQPNIDDDVLAVEVVDEGWPDQLALIPLEEVGEGGLRFLLAVGAELLVLGIGVSAFHSLARSCHWQLFLFALVERVHGAAENRSASDTYIRNLERTHTFRKALPSDWWLEWWRRRRRCLMAPTARQLVGGIGVVACPRGG